MAVSAVSGREGEFDTLSPHSFWDVCVRLGNRLSLCSSVERGDKVIGAGGKTKRKEGRRWTASLASGRPPKVETEKREKREEEEGNKIGRGKVKKPSEMYRGIEKGRNS